jgi:hypothetical protein
MAEIPDIPEELPLADEAGVVAEAAASLPEGEAAASQEICGGTPTSQGRDVGHPAPGAMSGDSGFLRCATE